MASNKRGWTGKESFNWDEISTERPPALDAGLYRFEVSEASAQATSKGSAGIKLQLKFTEPFGGSAGDLDGKSVKCFDTIAITKESAFKVKALAMACGIDPPASSGVEDVEAFAEELLGSNGGIAYVSPDTYNGQTNNKVKRYVTEEQASEQTAGVSPAGSDAAPAVTMKRRKRGGDAAPQAAE